MPPSITTAMVLAAGKGTRLAPLTNVLPKPLCEVAGVPLIRLALRQLHAAGVTRAVVNLHHLGEHIAAALGPNAEGVVLAYSREDTILGTGGGIARALPLLGDAPFFVLNADALQDVDLKALADAHAKGGGWATLALRPDPDVLRYGPVGVDAQGRVRRLVDAFDDGGARDLLMFTGVHVLEPRAVAHLDPNTEQCIIRQGYAALLARGVPLWSHVHHGTFHDVGTPPRWWTAQRGVLDATHAGILARATAGLEPRGDGVWVAPDVVLAPDVRLTGPVVLQAGARVEAGGQVGPFASVGRDAVVGAGATVVRAALHGGARLGPGAVLQDAVVGGGVTLGWPAGST